MLNYKIVKFNELTCQISLLVIDLHGSSHVK